MEDLRTWITEWVDGKKIEPRSGLGQAIAYMQTQWTELTQFLRVPSASLDNNKAERIIKMAILHRKNSLFYRTQRGAAVGDIFMSLVETCRSNEVNPFDYMLAVVRNAARAEVDPGTRIPWNFQTAIAQPAALPPSIGPPRRATIRRSATPPRLAAATQPSPSRKKPFERLWLDGTLNLSTAPLIAATS